MRRSTKLLLLCAVARIRGERCGAFVKGALSVRARHLRVAGILKHWVSIRLRRNVFLRQRKKRRWWVSPMLQHHDTHGAWASLIPVMRETDPDAFYNFHRCSVDDFDRLLDLVGPHIEKNSKRKSICPGERLSITLRYLSSGDYMVSLKYLYLVSASCLSAIIRETTYAIWYSLKPVVFQPISTEFWLEKAAEFESMWQCPHCCGALDGKHCAFQAFACSGSENYNYKGFHSLVLMAVCDAKYKFISVDAGANGRRNDNDVFHNSLFGQCLENGTLRLPAPTRLDGDSQVVPYVFVGDGIFTLSKNLLIPFPGEFIPPEEKVYNYRLSRARRVVENAFGVLSARYRILRKTVIASMTLAKGIILACCALHNFHLDNEDILPPHLRRYMPPKYVDFYKDDGKLVLGRWRNENKGLARSIFLRLSAETPASNDVELSDGYFVREKFMEYFIKNPVPWQWSKIATARRPRATQH